MKTVTELSRMRDEAGDIVLAAGFFDGVHIGHRQVLSGTVAAAAADGGAAWVLTFETHPLRVLDPRSAPPLITTNAQKLRLLSALDLDGCLLLPFSRDLSDLDPAAFVAQLMTRIPALRRIVVGRNWRFGQGGRGDTALLAALGRGGGLQTTVVPPLMDGDTPVSSTRIRQAVVSGGLAEAARLLGRPFSAVGTVAPGRTVGRRLGFPTANLDSGSEVLPPTGVYAVHAVLGGRVLDGVLNLGFRPTFDLSDAKGPLMELHLLDFQGEIYGRSVEVFFRERLRSEERFPSEEALRSRIARDVAAARAVLAGKKPEEWLYTYSCGVL